MVSPRHASPIPAAAIGEWPGKVVLVTGGAQGIGKGIAEAVLAAGGSVLIGDLDAEAGKACLDEWNVPERAAFLVLDVSKEASVKRFVDGALRRFGRIDGLVNNAGIADPVTGPLETLDWSEWKRRIDTNLGGVFLCCKHALPALKRANGAIVNIASSRAHQSEPDTEAYAASKGGIVAFTHALAISAGPVRVNAINPGWIAVDDWKKPSARRKPKLTAADHAQHPVGRVGVPPDIGALAVFLLSSQAGFITGENITLDGGVTRKMHYV
ncbi:NAD(P)-dependent dehydrogenase, short-chain alcohol dehydrogenase family [Luteibacter sp. UNCMF331Sha3.1]|uniref:SDR family oxidoreductase n=1 Tax=Luteibacter sp. UNCMF331Sha3.1 TaxID=1502760 RepID=UPI0008AC6256|nr:SDR family oxidoreductase [Luteibacter sp. UNCMF331Sha3.1]SEM88924.1 NAD(P)-dependent dehydrogenase, short-chain alcohol dehydrogenase family [Luteibacter sp. UNCMF331Sha3.1]